MQKRVVDKHIAQQWKIQLLNDVKLVNHFILKIGKPIIIS